MPKIPDLFTSKQGAIPAAEIIYNLKTRTATNCFNEVKARDGQKLFLVLLCSEVWRIKGLWMKITRRTVTANSPILPTSKL